MQHGSALGSALVAMGLSAPLAGAQIDYTADLRVVEASAGLVLADPDGGDPQVFNEDHADMPDPLFGVFDASELALILGPGGNTATALAVQNSSVIGGVLTATGFVETQVNLADVAAGSSGVAAASSDYRVGFAYEEGVYYILRITGEIAQASPDDGGQTGASVRFGIGFEGGNGEPSRYQRRLTGATGSGSFSDRVLLGPGAYEYLFSAASSVDTTQGNPGQSEASYSVTIEVIGRPCSFADFAEPYFQLDLADIEAYIQAYIGPDPIVDYVEPFGVVDLAEIIAFVQAFQAGCP